MSLRKAQDDVRAWRLHCGLSNGIHPQMPERSTANLHERLLTEEWREACQELHKLGKLSATDAQLAHLAKELADVIFVALGCAADLGIDMAEVWDAVVESNMTKGPSTDGTGKIVKGPGYVAPDVVAIIRRQVRGGEL